MARLQNCTPDYADLPSDIWGTLRAEAEQAVKADPVLSGIINRRILQADSLTGALAILLAEKLNSPSLDAKMLETLFREIYAQYTELEDIVKADMAAIRVQDPAAQDFISPFMFYKGFQSIQAHRLAHRLWQQGRKTLALYLQSRVSMVFGVDIHPAATVGRAVVFDHASSIVIGETARIGNNVLIMHGVTLGGKGNQCGARHPIIEDGVTIGACAQILGRITVATGAFVAAGSLVVKPVEAHTTVAGVPAKVIKQNMNV